MVLATSTRYDTINYRICAGWPYELHGTIARLGESEHLTHGTELDSGVFGENEVPIDPLALGKDTCK